MLDRLLIYSARFVLLFLLSAIGTTNVPAPANRTAPAAPPAPSINISSGSAAYRIAFASDRDRRFYFDIYTMNPDGSDLRRVTDNLAEDKTPAWSPDGTKLVFETNLDGHFQLYLINADGTNQTRFTNDTADDKHPVWIPGCTDRIVYASNQGGADYQIYSINPDGTNVIRLTSTAAGVSNDFPAWSGLPTPIRVPGPCCVPGVAFSSLRDGNSEIYLMRADGSQLTRLTFNPAIDQNPAPSPEQTRASSPSPSARRRNRNRWNAAG